MLEWFQNPTFSIAFAVALMFFGYFFGLFEGRGQGYKRRKAEEAEEVETGEPETEVEPLPPASPPLPSDETPVLNLSMDEAGELHLKLDGQQADISSLDAGQRKRLIEILTQMRPWLEVKKPAPPPPQPKPASSPQGISSPKTTPPPQSIIIFVFFETSATTSFSTCLKYFSPESRKISGIDLFSFITISSSVETTSLDNPDDKYLETTDFPAPIKPVKTIFNMARF